MDEPDFLMGSRGGFSNSDPVFCQGLNLIQIGTESDQSKLWSANHVYPLVVTHILESENSWKVYPFLDLIKVFVELIKTRLTKIN